MICKKLKFAFLPILGSLFLGSVAITGCGNNSDSKDEKKDTAAVKTETFKTVLDTSQKKADTTMKAMPKVDSAGSKVSKRPIVPSN